MVMFKGWEQTAVGDSNKRTWPALVPFSSFELAPIANLSPLAFIETEPPLLSPAASASISCPIFIQAVPSHW